MGHRADRRRRKREEAQEKKRANLRAELIREGERRSRYDNARMHMANVNVALLMAAAASEAAKKKEESAT